MFIPQVRIADVTLPILSYQSEPVVTFAMIDAVHQRPKGTARRNFLTNKRHLIEGEDFYPIDSIRLNEIRSIYPGLFPDAMQRVTFLTETGYLMLVKSFTDDLAWQVQRQLVKSYFRTKPSQQVATTEPRDPVVISIDQREAMNELMNDVFGIQNFSGHNRTYNLLRIRYNLRRIDDLPAEHFDEAMATIRAKKPLLAKLWEVERHIRNTFYAEVIGEGEPLTAWICRQVGGAQHVPANPDWKALSYQILRHQGVLPRQ